MRARVTNHSTPFAYAKVAGALCIVVHNVNDGKSHRTIDEYSGPYVLFFRDWEAGHKSLCKSAESS